MEMKKRKARSGNYGQENGKPSHQGLSNFNNTTKCPSTSVPVYNMRGTRVGVIEGDTFIKRARSNKHLLRYPPAWSNDISIFKLLIAKCISKLIVHDLDTGFTYESSLQNYLKFGKTTDRGSGKQIYLELIYWVTLFPDEYQLHLDL